MRNHVKLVKGFVSYSDAPRVYQIREGLFEEHQARGMDPNEAVTWCGRLVAACFDDGWAVLLPGVGWKPATPAQAEAYERAPTPEAAAAALRASK